ncbi:uncharacterized protein EI90DRAFT_3129288 [Cantharellus anzutake]|uniref:uncharacterized protein n=1 Tax=Cantharellus anzutake TaxID=1750568 RepID=UPI0019031E59|nr:uncharacterized protein EI90DRAFT_3129288 [Cantharellus anzutake]KAF8324995.1 hypothetical protein EI90DRAFT_3129288 [Cantharellus anzutake]
MLGGNLIAMRDPALCETCHVQWAAQGHLLSPTPVSGGDNDSDGAESVSTVDNEPPQGDVLALEESGPSVPVNQASDSGGNISYPSLSTISNFAAHMRSLMPDSAGSGSFSLSAPTQEDLVLMLEAEIIACYDDDPNLISLDKFVGNVLSFTIENSEHTQGYGVVREVIFQLSELLFPKSPENEKLLYLEGIPTSKEHKELAFVHGVVTALLIVHLCRLPCQLCILSVLLHLNYGKHEVITDSILTEHHQDLSFALDQFKASGSFTAIQSIAIPYLEVDAVTARPMIATEEAQAIFSQKLLLACIQGPGLVGNNDEEAAFRAGLNLICSNGFQFSEASQLGVLVDGGMLIYCSFARCILVDGRAFSESLVELSSSSDEIPNSKMPTSNL